jgi:hypothetical protein
MGNKSYEELANALVLEHGTEEEIERFKAGVLPEQERDKIVNDVLFAPILDIPLKRKAKEDGVRKYAMDIGLAVATDTVSFQTLEEEELEDHSAEEWDTLKRIKRSMPQAVVKTYEVRVECGRYKRSIRCAKVEVPFGDRFRRLDFVLNPSEYQKSRAPQPEVDYRRGR